MTINLEIDMLLFVYVYNALKQEALKEPNDNDPFKKAMLKEAYEYVANELSEQYTEEHGEYLERRTLIKKALLNKS